jgi:hypothetical protein
MGERQNGPFQLSFNASLKVDFQGSRVTSDGGLVLVRELDERLGFGEVSVQSAQRSPVAGHGVHGRSRTTLSGLPARHSGEKGEPQRLQDTPIVVRSCRPRGQKGDSG